MNHPQTDTDSHRLNHPQTDTGGHRLNHPAACLAGLVLLGAFVVAPDDRLRGATADWSVRLVDVAEHAGLRTPIVYGGVDRKRFIIETNGCGVALVDVDDDGWVDVLLLNGTRLEEGSRRERTWAADQAPTCRLYRNRRNGTFEDITSGSGLEKKVGLASSVCVGDVDNDRRVDLFITYFGTNVLYRNLGDGKFQDVTRNMGLAAAGPRWGSGCSFLDYDRDGRQDLFVANYLSFDLAKAPEPGEGPNCTWKGVPVNCGPKGLPTDTNLLFRNVGGRFEDVSDRSRISAVTGRYGMTASAADFDGDGWTDIYVAADSTAAILYRNNRDGTFTDVALESGAAYSEHGAPQAGMGIGIGDYNSDTTLDILKTHFADDIPALYRNLGGGLFEDVATMAGLNVENRYVQWGAGLPDLDNDGWPDAFYVTGNVYPEVETRLPQYPHRSPRVVFRNLGNGRFVTASESSGPGPTARHSSRGAAFGDIDNDGDLDILIMNMNELPSLLRSERAPGHHWLMLKLEGAQGTGSAVGATVLATVAGRTQARAVLSQSSYYSHDDLRAHFGLGQATRADRIEVRWPSGTTSVRLNVPADQVVTIPEKESTGQSRPEGLPPR
jgi:enediyne biosynthesis protein E4